MRKKFFAIMVVAVITIAGYNIYHSHGKVNNLSDLAVANIEALAIGEFTPNGWTCFYRFVDDTSSDLFVPIIRCSDCYTVTATAAVATGFCWH